LPFRPGFKSSPPNFGALRALRTPDFFVALAFDTVRLDFARLVFFAAIFHLQ